LRGRLNMGYRAYLIIASLAFLSCTAYNDPPRPTVQKSPAVIETSLNYRLGLASEISSMAVDRMGNCCYTDPAGWILASVGWDGSEMFRLNLTRHGDQLITGGSETYWLINFLDRKIRALDKKGQQTAEIIYYGITVNTGAVTLAGEIYLLDGNNARIKVIDRQGHEVRSFQIQAEGDGVLRPGSISVDDSRNILALADGRNGKVVFYNLYGTKQSILNIPVGNHPQAVCFDYLGRIWTCQPELGKVVIYSNKGSSWVAEAELTLREPYAVAMSPFGSGAVVEDGNLVFVKF